MIVNGIDDQITALIEEQCELMAFLRENWKTLQADYRREILAAIDALVAQEGRLQDVRFQERRKAWATE